MILNNENKDASIDFLKRIIDVCVDFKLNEQVNQAPKCSEDFLSLIEPIPLQGNDINLVLAEFEEKLLKHSTNFSSKNFMGFPDSGNSVAAMAGSILAELLQQNLINQSFCATTATFAEIAVITWLREVVGYNVSEDINSVWDVGGIITPGGTSSNCIAMMLARENHIANTLQNGVREPEKYKIIIPQGIGHYSIKSSQMWLGLGNNMLEVPTIDYKIDLKHLKKTLIENKGNIMAVVCYAGDSRTMAIDNLEGIYNTVKEIDDKIWLHADACHGFSLGFSETLRHKINYIEHFDSITTDPHKVLCTPYVISALLMKDPKMAQRIASFSDLIMKEDFAFGQITPFLGSRNWTSLKLWFLIKNLGKSGMGKIIEKRHQLALYLSHKLSLDKDFVVLNDVGINSVMFLYTRDIVSHTHNTENINNLNKILHKRMLEEGKFHLHQFPIADDKGILSKDTTLYPLRYMGGNPNTTESDIDQLIEYIKDLAHRIESEEIAC